MRIFFKTKSVNRYIKKEIKYLKTNELFSVRFYFFFYIVKVVSIPDFL